MALFSFKEPPDDNPVASDPILAQSYTEGGVWAWVAGLAIIGLIAFVVIAGWNADRKQPAQTAEPRALGTCTSTTVGTKVHLKCGGVEFVYDKAN